MGEELSFDLKNLFLGSCDLIGSDAVAPTNAFLQISSEDAKQLDSKLDVDDAVALSFLIVENLTSALTVCESFEKATKNCLTHAGKQLGIVQCLKVSADANQSKPWSDKLYQGLYLLGQHRLLYELGIEEDEARQRLRGAVYLKQERACFFRLCELMLSQDQKKFLELLSGAFGIKFPSSDFMEVALLKLLILEKEQITGQGKCLCEHVLWALQEMERGDLVASFKADNCGSNKCPVHRHPVGGHGYTDYYEQGPGLCIILNQKLFRKSSRDPEAVELTDRLGTDRDRAELEQTFTILGADIEVKNDLTRDQMIHFFSDVARTKANNSKYKWLAVCILSHGRRVHEVDEIMGHDGLGLNRETIIDSFQDPRKCPNLFKKPKLFFFQACRNNDNAAVTPQPQVQTPKPLLDVVVTDSPGLLFEGHPLKGDTFIASATIKDFVTYRSTIQGSFFIRHLCDALVKYGHVKPIEEVLKIVRKSVVSDRPDFASMTTDNSTLFKTFVFKRTKESLEKGAHMMIKNTLHLDLLNDWAASRSIDM